MVDSFPDAHDIDPQSSGRCSSSEGVPHVEDLTATARFGSSSRQATPTRRPQQRRRSEGAGTSRPARLEDVHEGELPSWAQPPVRAARPARGLTRRPTWEPHGGSRNARANSPDGKLAPSAARRTSKSSGRSPTNRKSPTLKLSRPTRFLRGELTLGTNRLTRKELQEQRRRLRRQGVTVKPNTAPRGKPRQRGQNRTNDFT